MRSAFRISDPRVRSLALILAMTAGSLSPAAAALAPALRPLLMLMLFLSFLSMRFRWADARWSHAAIPLVGVALGVSGYFLLRPISESAAFAALLIGITPTATAAPVISRMLGAEGAYATFAVLTGNLFAAWAIPVVLARIGAGQVPEASDLLRPVLFTLLVPLLAARLLRRLAPRPVHRITSWKLAPFGLWLGVLFLTSASAIAPALSERPLRALLPVFLTAAALCVVQFSLGRLLGGARFRIEAGQSLGQKNTMLTVWIALQFLWPEAALGPALYILCHNLANAWQISRHRPDPDAA